MVTHLELAIEVRTPQGFKIPVELDPYGAHAYVDVRGGRSQPHAALRLAEAASVDGHWVIPATVPLETSSSNKYLRASFNKDNDGVFPLALRSRPLRKDLEWSAWIESAWNASQPRPAPKDAFFVRYRVQVVEPRPPGPAAEDGASGSN